MYVDFYYFYLRRRLARGERIVTFGICVCLCVRRSATARRISLGGEGNALHPVFSSLYFYFLVIFHHVCVSHVCPLCRLRPKLHYSDTGYGHVVQHHQKNTNGQAHNNSTTNLPHRNARAQHLDMSRCCDVANFCPLVVTLLYNKL